MVRVCAQCHSPEIAAQQSLDAQGWKALVNQMANNGANATDAEFDTIAKYLAPLSRQIAARISRCHKQSRRAKTAAGFFYLDREQEQ